MGSTSELTLECMAIGSLPHNNLEEAMEIVKTNFNRIPFWPQLAKINKNEDMILQFLENMPSFFSDKDYLDCECNEFFEQIEQFFADYEEITSFAPMWEKVSEGRMRGNDDIIEKYSIHTSLSFPNYIQFIKDTKPNFAKGQVTGPFTLSTTLVDNNGKCAFYDETLREIIVKTLSLKALWQIKQIKKANTDTTPIIFIDEPSISQLGTSAFITISQEDVIEMIKSVSDIIKANGGLSAIHCCGKCDWRVPIKAGVNIINLDAYSYAENLSTFSEDIKKHLEAGGKIAWGVIPTLDSKALEELSLEKAVNVFENAVKYLTKKGINEKIIIENSLVTPSCGAGSLSEKLAEKAMKLTKELSIRLKERYYGV